MLSKGHFCTCEYYDCEHHPIKHDGSCNPCIEKNLANKEIPACFWNKIGSEGDCGSQYTFRKFAERVIDDC
ncbi:MAG: DUF6485 family protein [Defluviitaleaceae bacterium]|nr:DUF6485 family protein [Defluviitaleaceae bacterium]